MRVVAHAGGATSNEATYTWQVGDSSGEAEVTPLAETETPVHRAELHVGEQAQEQTAACKPGLRPQVKDDRQVPATWNDPADIVFGLGEAAQTDGAARDAASCAADCRAKVCDADCAPGAGAGKTSGASEANGAEETTWPGEEDCAGQTECDREREASCEGGDVCGVDKHCHCWWRDCVLL